MDAKYYGVIIILVIALGYGAYFEYRNVQMVKERLVYQQIEQLAVRSNVVSSSMMSQMILDSTGLTNGQIAMALKDFQSHASSSYDIGLVASIAGNYSAALQYYNDSDQLSDVVISKANVEFMTTNYNDALADYKKASSVDTGSFPLYGIAASYYMLKDYDSTLTYAIKSLQIEPDNYNALILEADTLFLLQRYSESITPYTNALAKYPDDPDSWFHLGIAQGNIGRYADSLSSFNQVISLEPSNINAWYDKGYTLVNLKKYSDAIDAFNHTLQLNPNYIEAWNNIGNSYGMLGKYDDALASYDKIIALDANNTNAWYNKALTLQNLTRFYDAKQALVQVCKIDFNYPGINCGKII